MLKGNMLIAHGGGPTAVINMSLLGAIEEAKQHANFQQILGARHGVEGIFGTEFIDLGNKANHELEKLRITPSSAIGSCRRKLTDKDYPKILDVFREYNIRHFFYNGGNDSMDSCNKISMLAKTSGYDMRIIGIPKTIDNDLMMTDSCPGYGSAARYVAETLRELAQEVHALPIHVVVVEVMGRNAGWLAASAALAIQDNRGPHLIYLPEIPLDEDKFLYDVKSIYDKHGYALVVVSEGLINKAGEPIATSGILDGFGHIIPGGVAEYLSKRINTKLGIKSRSEKPGLIGRNAVRYRSEVDIEQAYAVGKYAVKSAAEGHTGNMVAIKRTCNKPFRYELELVDLEQVANLERKFPLDWINSEGNGIKEDFYKYCLPLIGNKIQDFVLFE